MELYEIILDLCPYSYFLNKTKATLERNLIFQISLLPDLPIRGWLSEYWVFRLLLESLSCLSTVHHGPLHTLLMMMMMVMMIFMKRQFRLYLRELTSRWESSNSARNLPT